MLESTKTQLRRSEQASKVLSISFLTQPLVRGLVDGVLGDSQVYSVIQKVISTE